MTFRFRTIAVAAALASLGHPLAAQSSACVQPEDLADTVTYAMPLFLQGLQSKCATALPADSFILSQGESFAQSFEPLRDEAWPGARRTLMRFIESEAAAAEDSEGADATTAGFVQILSSLDGDELRPFVDGIGVQLIAEEIKPATCGDIEKVLPLLAPLPPQNYGGLVSAIFGLVSEGESDGFVCAAAAQ